MLDHYSTAQNTVATLMDSSSVFLLLKPRPFNDINCGGSEYEQQKPGDEATFRDILLKSRELQDGTK